MSRNRQATNQDVSDYIFCWAKKSKLLEIASGRVFASIEKDMNDFLFEDGDTREIAGNSLYKSIWAAHKSLGPLPPIDLLQEFEHNRVFYPDYRDHTMHSLTTCLLGLYIYENNKTIRDAFSSFILESFSDEYSDDVAFVITWVLTSLYHDIGYLVENTKIDLPEYEEYKKQVIAAFNEMLKNPLASTPHFKNSKENEHKFIQDYGILTSNVSSIDFYENEDNFKRLMFASEASYLGMDGSNGVKCYYDFTKSHVEKQRKSIFRDHGISSAYILKAIDD